MKEEAIVERRKGLCLPACFWSVLRYYTAVATLHLRVALNDLCDDHTDLKLRIQGSKYITTDRLH